ncbi:hypothetical protein EAF04_003878 [Stromatinia cepivora]|nr:hypothetical protein EAF04_003878 [Stromatinia cepivora]
MPGDGKFNYPVNKKRTKQNTEQMVLGEKNLDHFWGILTLIGRNWRGGILNKNTAQSQTIQEPQTKEWGHNEENDKVKTTSKKGKVKTKGSPQRPTQPEAQPENIEVNPQLEVQRKVKIPYHLARVFNTLFFQPGQNNTPGDVPWVEFLKAMVEMGFAAQNWYGSVWQFTPVSREGGENTGAEKSIQFHEPHPGVKISFNVARRMGRRLMRSFGWWGGMFEEE